MNLCLAHGGDVSSPSGGTDRVTALAGGLADRNHDVALVVPEPEHSLPERLSDVDVVAVNPSIAGLTNALTRAASVTAAAAREARDRNAVLQVEHSTLAGIGTLHTDVPFVLDMHDLGYGRYDHVDSLAAPFLTRGVSWLERRAVERAQNVIVVSEYMREVLESDWGAETGSVEVVPNGFFPGRIEPYRDAKVVDGRVCFLGTLHPKVDVDVLREVATLSSVSELVIVGDGAQRAEVDELASEQDVVHATGRLPDDEAFEYVSTAEVLVNPQEMSEIQRSSSPVKLFYYAAVGRPMVVSLGPPLVDRLADRDAALVAGGPAAFVQAVSTLLDDEARAATVAENAREAARDFRWDSRVDDIADLYANWYAERGVVQ